MPKTLFNYILLFFALVVSQAVIFNNLIIMNTAVALVFLYLIVVLPITMSTNAVLTVSFLLGLSVDIFQDTPGLNAAACTVIGFIRRPILHLYMPKDEEETDRRLGINTLGPFTFLKYILTVTVIYCILYFGIEAITYLDFKRLLLRMGASAAFTIVVLFAIDSLTIRRREKKL